MNQSIVTNQEIIAPDYYKKIDKGKGERGREMGKSNISSQQQSASTKSIIARDKLSDGDFDKLVTDISLKISQKLASESKIEQLESQREKRCSLVDGVEKDKSGQSSSVKLDQPKRPMNAFMVWGQAIRRELHDKFSNVQNALLSKALGRVWRTLDASQKEPHMKKANLIKAHHKRDYPNYRYRPRRIQERRLKCNMLIGIQLDHPVNEQPKLAMLADNQKMAQNPFLQTTTNVQRAVSDSHHSVYGDVGGNVITRTDRAQTIDGVQKFEYQPYPYNSRVEAPISRFMSYPKPETSAEFARNYQYNGDVSQSNSNDVSSYLKTEFLEGRQEYTSNAHKISPQNEFSYSQYHSQFFYGMQPQQQQQQQQQHQQQQPHYQHHQPRQHKFQNPQLDHYNAPIATISTTPNPNYYGETSKGTSPTSDSMGVYYQAYNRTVEYEDRLV